MFTSVSPSRGKTHVVIVVDDECWVRIELVDILQSSACKAYEAGNASEAIAVLEQNEEVQVMFSDIQMPGDMNVTCAIAGRRQSSSCVQVTSDRAQLAILVQR